MTQRSRPLLGGSTQVGPIMPLVRRGRRLYLKGLHMAGSIAAWIIGAPFVAIVLPFASSRTGSHGMGGGTKTHTSGEGLPRR